MARSRTTFGKMERERAKQQKAREKSERRAARESLRDDAPGPVETVDPEVVLARLQQLQNALAAGEVDAQEFEAQRDHLRQMLNV